MLHVILLLKRNDRWVNIEKEMAEAYGLMDRKNLREWRYAFQDALATALHILGCMRIGGPKEVVVFDETIIGLHKAVRTGADRSRTYFRSRALVRKRVLKKMPGRTVWKAAYKRPAACTSKGRIASCMRSATPASTSHLTNSTGSESKRDMSKRPAACDTVSKKPSASVAGTDKDPRGHGRWLWMAVTVGKGQEVYTHANGKKRMTFAILPRAEDAPNKKPRGHASMTSVVEKYVNKGSFLIFDGWRSSEAAVKQLGYCHAPPVNHSIGWRDTVTGFHSNDIESENSRLKGWLRARYTDLRISVQDQTGGEETYNYAGSISRDLSEYCYNVNVGPTVGDAMKGVAAAAGGSVQPFRYRLLVQT